MKCFPYELFRAVSDIMDSGFHFSEDEMDSLLYVFGEHGDIQEITKMSRVLSEPHHLYYPVFLHAYLHLSTKLRLEPNLEIGMQYGWKY